jgi:hypothetical protein
MISRIRSLMIVRAIFSASGVPRARWRHRREAYSAREQRPGASSARPFACRAPASARRTATDAVDRHARAHHHNSEPDSPQPSGVSDPHLAVQISPRIGLLSVTPGEGDCGVGETAREVESAPTVAGLARCLPAGLIISIALGPCASILFQASSRAVSALCPPPTRFRRSELWQIRLNWSG